MASFRIAVGPSICVYVLWLVAGCLCYSQREEKKRPAQPWQVQGILAALDDPLPGVHLEALRKLGTFSKVDGIQSSRVAAFLMDTDEDLRFAAVSALGAMQAKDQVTEVLKLLKDPK